MKLNLEKGRLVIELPAESAELLVNGAKQAEYFLGVAEGPEDFRKRLRQANAAHSACAIMRRLVQAATGPVCPKRQSAVVAGFLAGLRGEYRRIHPKGVAGGIQPPDCGNHEWADFSDGWESGSAVWAAVQMAETGKDPREDW